MLRLFGSPLGLQRIVFGQECPQLASPCAVGEELTKAATQLEEYFAGQRRQFDLTLDLRGSPFQRSVWQAVMAVPYGETRSYGEIARQLGRPSAARAVGAANGANPLPIVIPCHRLVGSSGALTGYGGGLEMKRRLLEMEGERGTMLPLA